MTHYQNNTIRVATTTALVAMGMTTVIPTETEKIIKFEPTIDFYKFTVDSLTSTKCYHDIFYIDDSRTLNISDKNLTASKRQQQFENNNTTLDKLEKLPYNWNGNGAEPFSKKFIENVRILIRSLVHQPRIFPLADFGVQLEYHGKNNSYLEIDLSDKEVAEIYQVDIDGNETESTIRSSADNINNLVENFYGRNI